MTTAEAVFNRQQGIFSAVLGAKSHALTSGVWDQLLDFDSALTTFPPAELAQAATNLCEAFGKQHVVCHSACVHCGLLLIVGGHKLY